LYSEQPHGALVIFGVRATAGLRIDDFLDKHELRSVAHDRERRRAGDGMTR